MDFDEERERSAQPESGQPDDAADTRAAVPPDAPADVSAELLLPGDGSGRGDAGDTRRGVRVQFAWWAQDALAVVVRLRPVPDHPALPRGDWVVLRDFLRYALEEPTGDGDVRLTPEPEVGELAVELQREGRCQTVRVPCWSVKEFLDETERLVPSGAEATDEVIDALITRLLED